MKNCFQCGKELKKGVLRSPRLIYWTDDAEPGMYLPIKKAGDIVPPGASRWMGSDCPAFYCETCGLILISTKEDDEI